MLNSTLLPESKIASVRGSGGGLVGQASSPLTSPFNVADLLGLLEGTSSVSKKSSKNGQSYPSSGISKEEVRQKTLFPQNIWNRIAYYLPRQQLLHLQQGSRSSVLFIAASTQLYRHIIFAQMSGHRLAGLVNTLLLNQGYGINGMDYGAAIRSISIQHIVLEDWSLFQSWRHVKELLRLSPNVHSITLGTGDDSFSDMSPTTASQLDWFGSGTSFPKLRHLTLTPRCGRLPEQMVIELLRCCPVGGMELIQLPYCLGSFGGAGWWLLAERGGKALKELILTPAVDPIPGGWKSSEFHDGMAQLTDFCPNLEVLDVSGHRVGFTDQNLRALTARSSKLHQLYLPCGLNDSHLLSVMDMRLTNLSLLSLACRCLKPDHRSAPTFCCNIFTDAVLRAFVDKALANRLLLLASSIVPTQQQTQLVLPRFIVEVAHSAKIPTMRWARELPGAFQDPFDPMAIIYMGVKICVEGGGCLNS